jgi:tetratricopeptide (TPR) repeat protein
MTVVRRAAVVVALAVLLLPALSADPLRQARPPDRWLTQMLAWLAAVNTHLPGRADTALGISLTWSLADLESALADVLALGHRLGSERKGAVAYRGRLFSQVTLRPLFGLREDEPTEQMLNRLLRRGAVYHSDVAIWMSRDNGLGGRVAGPGATALLVGDGRQRAQTTTSVHWLFGRELLDREQPGPGDDELARLWYLAAAAYLQATRMVTEADVHLSRARQIFPREPELLFEGGCAIETLTAPSLQAALGAAAMSPRQLSLLPSERSLLGRAETLFGRALQYEPTLAEARVRLARLLAVRGQHEAARAQLRQVVAARTTNELRYLALMLIGDEEQAAGRRGDARERYEEAAALFPTAQSPLLALTELAREGRDRDRATATLERLSKLSVKPEERVDPWWAYYYGMRGRDVRERLAALYERLEADTP